MSTRAGSRVSAALLVVLAGCGGDGRGAELEPTGVQLIAGSSLLRQGWLLVPSSGGPARYRALLEPSRILWTGSTELPATSAAYGAGATVVLREPTGSVWRFDPARDRLVSLPDVPDGAVWHRAEAGGAFSGDGFALAVTPDGVRTVSPSGPVLWASPVADGRVATLTTTDSAGEALLQIWPAEGESGEEPVASRTMPAGASVLAAVFGARLIVTNPAEREVSQYTVPELERTGGVEVEGPPGALAISPSGHEVYLAVSGGSRIVAIDRFEWRVERRAHRIEAISEIRASALSGQLLLSGAGGVWMVPHSADPVRLDAEWGQDLPVTLADGRVIGRGGDAIHMWDSGGGRLGTLDAPADAWWVHVEWAPPRKEPARLAAEEGDDPAPGAREAPMAPPSGGDARFGRAESPAPGFYVVAASSRREAGVQTLGMTLADAGYRAAVFPHMDEAGDTWFRLMVGPFPARPDADEAEARLQRERGIDAWVSEVGGGR